MCAFLNDPSLDIWSKRTRRQLVRLHRQLVVVPERELSHAWDGRTGKPHHVPMTDDQLTYQRQPGNEHRQFARVSVEHVPDLLREIDPIDHAFIKEGIDER
jgi:hypothetical protein